MTTTTVTATTTQTRGLYSLTNVGTGGTLTLANRSLEFVEECGAPQWRISNVHSQAFTLEIYNSRRLAWQFLGHINHGPGLGPFAGDSFTWIINQTGTDTWTICNMVENHDGNTFLSHDGKSGLGLVRTSTSNHSHWLIPGMK